MVAHNMASRTNRIKMRSARSLRHLTANKPRYPHKAINFLLDLFGFPDLDGSINAGHCLSVN